MRLFLAFDIPEEICRVLSRQQEKLPGKIKKANEFHLTIKFLGEVEDSKVDEIDEKLKEVSMQKFEVSLGGTGVFPKEEYVKVAWAGIEPVETIGLLKIKIEDALKGMRFTNDHQFHPHITLARVKHLEDRREFLEVLRGLEIPKKNFMVESFKLYKSELGAEGPKYTLLKEHPLVA